MTADSSFLLGLEAALVLDSFSVQSELVWASVDSDLSDDPDFLAYYIQASYFLTGEHRPYSKSKAVFGRISPSNHYGSEAGSGAWELALRYSNLDLNEELVTGGELQTVTAGVNWYLNPNTKFAFNYIWADVEDTWGEGDAHFFVVRFQVDF
jgi:phosphate-selective porin OprO/OprP